MKNQYFGDDRDLFKYDLVMQIITSRVADHLTFIPMLTEPDNTKEGNQRKARAGTGNLKLKSFLDRCVEEGRRNIKELESFFKKRGVKATIYSKDCYFPKDKEKRKKYFKQIQDKLLHKSLILVDPDIGLEGDKLERSREKYILYSEIGYLYERMDRSSILMIFQYRPRLEKWEDCRQRIRKRLKKEVGNLPIYISEDPVIFFFLTKNDSRRDSVSTTLRSYAESYGLNKNRIGGW